MVLVIRPSDGSVIYRHPQSRLLGKMASLVGFKSPAPQLQADPVAVLDHKLDQEERRMKKDNRRWRVIIYFTVTVCLIIFGLVLAQVISSVTSSGGQLPNVDVTEAAAALDAPRHEPLLAGLGGANGRQRSPAQPKADGDPSDTYTADSGDIYVTVPGGRAEDDYVLTVARTAAGQLDMAVKAEGAGSAAHAAAIESALQEAIVLGERQQAEAVAVAEAEAEVEAAEAEAEAEAALQPEARAGYVAYVPVPLGGEETPTTATTSTTRRPEPPPQQRRPLFVPVMFQERQAAGRPQFVRRPSPVLTAPRPALLRPPPLPSGQTVQRPSLPPPAGHSARPQLALLLRRPGAGFPAGFNAHQEANLVRQPVPIGPLPLSVQGRTGDLVTSARPLTSVPPTLPSSVALSRLLGPRFPPRRPVTPAGLRPGPFRPPISVAPPHQPANQRPPHSSRRPFPPPPANHRPFPPPPTNQRPFAPPRSHGIPVGPSPAGRRFPSAPSVPLVGNPQYSYPRTATGIQDILSYINGDAARNGHGAYGRFSSGPVSAAGQRRDGPVYPAGYRRDGLALGSAGRPLQLMLDVYPVDNSDRYGLPAAPTVSKVVFHQYPDGTLAPASDQQMAAQSSWPQVPQPPQHRTGPSPAVGIPARVSKVVYHEYPGDRSGLQYLPGPLGGAQYFPGPLGGAQLLSRSRVGPQFTVGLSYLEDTGSYRGSRPDGYRGSRRDGYPGSRPDGGEDGFGGSQDDLHKCPFDKWHFGKVTLADWPFYMNWARPCRRLSLDIPLRHQQLTAHALYDAILAGKWLPPDDQPHFEFLQADPFLALCITADPSLTLCITADPSLTLCITADPSVTLCVTEPGASGRTSAEPSLAEELPKILAALRRRLEEAPQTLLELQPPAGEDGHGGQDGDRWDEEALWRADHRHAGDYQHGEDHRAREEHQYREDHRHIIWDHRNGEDHRPGEDHRHGEASWDHGRWQDRHSTADRRPDPGQPADGGQYDVSAAPGGPREQPGPGHGEEQRGSENHISWTSVQKINDLTEGYLRPDQVTRPPVTSRPTLVTSLAAAATHEPLPTPLASRRRPPSADGAGDQATSGKEGADSAGTDSGHGSMLASPTT
ncbi:hypothetical protein FJT64_006080 [Amphibalanus amphitrite]|uniref:Uncharacterized protein n=1 Tax=Amphibalanus amphitrite TaxID=1232801 RepID=A0A6A4W3U9_AMPAM|nr:hypothetical protein FJT64_006080 [Amphibalanus amphitrite]